MLSKEDNGNELLTSYLALNNRKSFTNNLTLLRNKEIDEFVEKSNEEMEKALSELKQTYEVDIKEMEGNIIS